MKFLRLIEAHKHAEIIDYVKKCKCLASYEELALIERGNHEEVMAYIAQHYFEIDTYRSFMERGNLNEIRFYILRHGIYYGDGEDELRPFLRNIANELVDRLLVELQMDANYGISIDDDLIACYEKLILQSGDHCALRRYLSQSKRPLQPESLKLFHKKGVATAEDLLVYKLLHED